jgi:hypothetical protein
MQQIARVRYDGGDALYPYLSSDGMRSRQALVSHRMQNRFPRRILDIGPYFSPIHQFLGKGCPREIVSVEVVGEAAKTQPPFPGYARRPYDSVEVACLSGGSTHLLVAPVTVQSFLSKWKSHLDMNFDAVVCLGCDAHFGPSPADLLSLSQNGAFDLYVEYPTAYAPSREAFGKLREQGSILFEADMLVHEVNNVTEFSQRHLEHIEIVRSGCPLCA